MHRLEQCSCRECIEIADFLNSITNDLLEEHVILIFEKLGVVIEAMDIWACHRLGKTARVIIKLLNRKDAQNILEEKHNLRSINLYDDNTDTNNKRKIFINQSLCPYYMKPYGMVKDLSNEGLIDSLWIANGTIKIWESIQSKPISITNESNLQFWGISILTWSILILFSMWWGYKIQGIMRFLYRDFLIFLFAQGWFI